MVVTDYAKNKVNLFLGGSQTDFPQYYIIGSGSGIAIGGDTELVHPVDRQSFTETTFPTSQKVTDQGDWNSVEISGIQLRQFGKTGSGVGLTGSMWSIVSLPALTFDGTNELRIEETWEVF